MNSISPLRQLLAFRLRSNSISPCRSLLSSTTFQRCLTTTTTDVSSSASTATTTPPSEIEQATLTWNKGMKLAKQNDPAALCDVGWGFHQGANPEQVKSIDTAIDYYLKSATLGYSPAASLLADIHYFDHDDRKDWSLAEKYLQEVIELTSSTHEGDAYLLAKALQKLGMIACRGDHPDRQGGVNYFRKSLDLCSQHLGGSWAFLLSHDPPGLFEQLQNEEKLLGNEEVLGRLMSSLVSVGQGESSDGSSLSQLQYYTRALRNMENNTEWVLKFQEDCLDTFPNSSTGGEWGVTYFQSSIRIFMEPVVQNAVARGHGGVGEYPKIVGIGSALGNAVAWPALSFGFRGIGFDVVDSCTQGAVELYTEAAEAIDRKNAVLGNALGGSAAGAVTFETMNVVENAQRIQEECSDANVVWLNDYAWSKDAQIENEENVMSSLPSGSVAVMYRPPHRPPSNSEAVKKIAVATSWNPMLDMHIVLKE